MKLLNIHKFHSSAKDKDYEVIQVVRPLTSREKNQGYVGSEILEEHFLPDDLLGKLSVSDVGKEINLVYEVTGGKAHLIDIQKGGN